MSLRPDETLVRALDDRDNDCRIQLTNSFMLLVKLLSFESVAAQESARPESGRKMIKLMDYVLETHEATMEVQSTNSRFMCQNMSLIIIRL